MYAEDSRIVDRRIVLLIATTASFLNPFMGSSVNIALPRIGREFGLDAILLGWVTTAYLLSAGVLLLPFGRLADIYGRKRIFLYGISVYTFSSLLCALAPSAGPLILFRVLQGIGGSMIFGTGVAILTSVFPPQERGKVLGLNVAAVYLGLSAGPFIGGVLTAQLGWRSVFLAIVPLGILEMGLILWKLKGEWAEAKGERFDGIGALLYGLMFLALIYGFSELPSRRGGLSLLAGLMGMVAFVLWETRVESPVLDIRLFQQNTVFAFSNLAALINYSATFAVSFLLSLYLQYIYGMDPQGAGLVLLVQPIVQAIFSPFAGRLSDRVEPRMVASLGLSLTVVGLFLLTGLRENTPLPMVLTGLVLLGLGFALFSSPNANAVMSSVERRLYGVASATLGTMRLTGQMLSMGTVMLIFALFLGREPITPERYGLFLVSARTAFVIFALLSIGAVFASLARGEVHREDRLAG
ncbi:MAG: MFS transporter [Armatimonadota bacterium]|nr:MFS transporter [Armatimonadota bacterium]MDR5702411.1 MFS transporter [Armatimonadota bacterium]